MVSPLSTQVLRGSGNAGLQAADIIGQSRQNQLNRDLSLAQNQRAEAQNQRAESQAQRSQQNFDQERAIGAARYLNALGKQILANPQQKDQILSANVPQLQQLGFDASQLKNASIEMVQSVVQQTEPVVQQSQPQLTGAERQRQNNFQILQSAIDPSTGRLKDRTELTPEQEIAAIDEGLISRAVGNAEQTLARDLGVSVQEVRRRLKLAEGQAKTSSKIIDTSFESIGKIQNNINNIDRAITALDNGARTGAIDRFLPNVTAASQELRQIQNELGLDVVGAVTFGALSESELSLALDTALPTGLNEPQLRDFLIRKREAQQKALANMREAIQFLDSGGTVGEFIQSKQSQAQSQGNENNSQAERPTQILNFDAQGNLIQ